MNNKNPAGVPLDEALAEMFRRDPKFKKAYEELAPEFERISKRIARRNARKNKKAMKPKKPKAHHA